MSDQNYWDNMWQNSPLLEGDIEENHNEYLCPEISHCIEKYCPSEGIKFLEAGCGLGVWNFWLEKYFASSVSVGVDKTSSLWQAQAYKRKRKLKSLFVQADVKELPFKDQAFNFITSLGVIEHFERPEELLLELKRLLVHEGILFIDTPNKSLWSFFTKLFPLGEHEDYYSSQELAQLLVDVGFEVVEAYSKAFSNTIMTPLYMLCDYDQNSFFSRAYHCALQVVKRVVEPLDKWLDNKYGFYSIVIARKIDF